MAILGPRVPVALKLFVVAFAIIDDLGAIVLIATVYTAEISATWLALALGIWALLLMLNLRMRIVALAFYLIGGVFLWYCVYRAGIHASIAGVMLAFAVPFSSNVPEAESPSHRLERWLHNPVAFVVLPLFALANTGVFIDATSLNLLGGANSLGIGLGLIVGKPLGIVLMCWVAVATGLCKLPEHVRWPHILGAGILGGIGFTMSIFITNLAFAVTPAQIASSKLAVLVASLISGLLGLLWLSKTPARH
jgi:NhaA family Na+:H+ antiporter